MYIRGGSIHHKHSASNSNDCSSRKPRTMSGPGTVLAFSPAEHSHLIPYLAAIHAACITHDRTVATFLPPLSHEKLLTWWKDCIAEVNAGTRVIFILVDQPDDDESNLRGPDVMGVVMLSMPWTETGQLRGFVEKLLVQKSFRGRGAARSLMSAVEDEAFRRGRTVLLLDTETGSPAEEVYKTLGWTEIGKVPAYSVSPSGELKGETFFYKQLQGQIGRAHV